MIKRLLKVMKLQLLGDFCLSKYLVKSIDEIKDDEYEWYLIYFQCRVEKKSSIESIFNLIPIIIAATALVLSMVSIAFAAVINGISESELSEMHQWLLNGIEEYTFISIVLVKLAICFVVVCVWNNIIRNRSNVVLKYLQSTKP